MMRLKTETLHLVWEKWICELQKLASLALNRLTPSLLVTHSIAILQASIVLIQKSYQSYQVTSYQTMKNSHLGALSISQNSKASIYQDKSEINL